MILPCLTNIVKTVKQNTKSKKITSSKCFKGEYLLAKLAINICKLVFRLYYW